MDQVRRRKIRIIDNLYVMKLLKSGDLGTGEEVKIMLVLRMDIKKERCYHVQIQLCNPCSRRIFTCIHSK